MDLSLFFAGTGGSVPSARRGLPAILARIGGDRILFDCGEGTQRQLTRSIGLVDMECIFITHFHADHWLGLPGMLKSFALREREQPLTVYGPRGLNELMADMRVIYGRPPYELNVVELDPAETVQREGYLIAAIPVSHRSRSAFGYAIVEPTRPGHLDPQLAEQLGVKPGPDFGRLQRGETVDGVSPEQVMGPEREGRKIVLSGDTEPCEAVKIAAHEADLLVHEATFTEEEVDRASQTAHSTARQAAELARDAEVRLLALTHISTRYAGGQLRDEARAVFPATEAPRDFDTIEVPFPERGRAKLERWSERQARERAAGGSGSEDEAVENDRTHDSGGGQSRADAPSEAVATGQGSVTSP
ncbi:MAG TPA: ribonuclease Z [Solirubrobacteraceae bacterium]|jgi:ribonuclease Z|nr:ribonuclease Z [Solirubrobacteraceae bacterium]